MQQRIPKYVPSAIAALYQELQASEYEYTEEERDCWGRLVHDPRMGSVYGAVARLAQGRPLDPDQVLRLFFDAAWNRAFSKAPARRKARLRAIELLRDVERLAGKLAGALSTLEEKMAGLEVQNDKVSLLSLFDVLRLIEGTERGASGAAANALRALSDTARDRSLPTPAELLGALRAAALEILWYGGDLVTGDPVLAAELETRQHAAPAAYVRSLLKACEQHQETAWVRDLPMDALATLTTVALELKDEYTAEAVRDLLRRGRK